MAQGEWLQQRVAIVNIGCACYGT